MTDAENTIYSLLKEWVEYTEHSDDRQGFEQFRTRFGSMENEAFGEISERNSDPLAMQYDRVRNFIALYIGQKEERYLEQVREFFEEIAEPE